jgi:hypothetical protein
VIAKIFPLTTVRAVLAARRWAWIGDPALAPEAPSFPPA